VIDPTLTAAAAELAPDRWTLGASLAASGLALWPLAQALARRLRPQRNVFFARWGFSHLTAVTAAGMLCFLLGSALLPSTGLGGFLRPDLFVLGAAAGALWVAARTQPEGWRALGLDRGRHGSAAVVGALVYLVCLPSIVGLALLWPSVAEALGADPRPAGAAFLAYAELDGGARWSAVALALGIGPLLRELVFRCFAQPLFQQNFSEQGGLLLGALLFALLQPVALFAPALAVGWLAGTVQLRTQSLAGPFTLHALHQVLWLTCGAHFAGLAPLL
jgi:membrane protease YdiL (CAAX protease family)